MPPILHREHGRPRYQKGCGCDSCVEAKTTAPCRCVVCTEANRAYSRRNKRLKSLNGGVPVEEATPPPGIRIERNPDLLVESAVKAELEGLNVTGMQGLSAVVLAMARILDDPTSVPQHPAAAGRLLAVMQTLRAHGKSGAGAGQGEAASTPTPAPVADDMAERRARLAFRAQ